MYTHSLWTDSGQVNHARHKAFLSIVTLCLLAFLLHPLPVHLTAALTARQGSSAKLIFFHNPLTDPTGASFQAVRPGETVSFLSNEVRLQLTGARGASGDTLLLHFSGANPAVKLEGGQPLPGVLNLYEGSDPSAWKAGLPTYQQVLYHQLYPGIDARFDGSQGLLKGTYLLAPGADPALIRWSYQGASAAQVNPRSGAFELSLADGVQLTEQPPLAWQEINGQQVRVQAAYRVDSATGELGFAVSGVNPQYALTIDPTLDFSTYFGGDSDEWANGVRTDAAGNIYFTGFTASTGLPGTGSRAAVEDDVFVTRMNSAGTQVVYTTLMGGNAQDEALALAVTPTGTAWITGDTSSNDFPTTSDAFQKALADDGDAFIARLNSTGALEFSSYVGGVGADFGRALALDLQGNAFMAGEFYFQNNQYLVLQVPAGSSPTPYGLYLNNMLNAQLKVTSIALDQSTNVYLTGSVVSDSFPVVNAVQNTCGMYGQLECSQDAYILVVNKDFNQILFSTYLGGTNSNGGAGDDEGRAIAVDPTGQNIYVGGITSASDFPVMNAFQDQKKGANNIENGFLTHLVRQGSGYALGYSTFVGGTRWSEVNALTVDASGSLYAAGFTEAADFPTKSALQNALVNSICLVGTERHCYDATVTELNPQGGLLFSTYWGGGSDDVARSITLTPDGKVLVSGYTDSFDFPTSSTPYQDAKNLKNDVFLLQVNLGGSPPVPPININSHVFLPLTEK